MNYIIWNADYPGKRLRIPSLSIDNIGEKVFWKNYPSEDDICSNLDNKYYLSVKVEFEFEYKVAHHAEKHKEPTKNKDVNPVDLKRRRICHLLNIEQFQ